MASARFAWGIDIGNRALKAIKLVPDGDRLRVDDVEVHEHEQILSTAGDNKESLVQNALVAFAQRHSAKGGVVAIGVSGQASFARFIKLPPVEPRKIPEIVKFEAMQQIPFPLPEVEWSYQLFQDADSPDVEVGIFAMRKELVNAHIKQFTDLDMNVQVVQMNPLAVYNAMAYDERLDGTTMIIDLGAENADLIICDKESVWLRTIPVGGNNFTEALAKSFKLNFPKAEELKRNAATSKYARQIFQAMRPVFSDLVSEVQRSIGFYASVRRDARLKRIIALGSTFRLPTLQKYLTQNLQIPVEKVDGFGSGAPGDGRLAAVLNENLGSLATAYGLAVQAMGVSKITSSLLPEQIRKAKLWKEKTKWFGLSAAMFVLGTVGAAGSWYLNSAAFEQQQPVRDAVDRTLVTAKTLDADWGKAEGLGQEDLDRIKQVTALTEFRSVWPRLVADLSAALPPVPQSAEAPQIKGIDRVKRPIITLDRFTSSYQPALASVLGMSDDQFKAVAGGGEAAGGARGPITAAGSEDGSQARPGGESADANARGFLLTLQCTTPNASGAAYVQQTLVANLLKITRDFALKNGRPYYIGKATVALARRVKEGSGRTSTAIGSAAASTVVRTGAGANRQPPAPVTPRRTPTTPNPANPDDAAAGPQFPDPLTGEDMADDWEVTVLVAVVLDPTPGPGGPAAGGDQPAAGKPAAGADGGPPAPPASPSVTPAPGTGGGGGASQGTRVGE